MIATVCLMFEESVYHIPEILLLDVINKDDVVQLTDVKPDPKKANPKVGPSQIAFSPDNRYVYSRNGNMHVVHLSSFIVHLQFNSYTKFYRQHAQCALDLGCREHQTSFSNCQHRTNQM